MDFRDITEFVKDFLKYVVLVIVVLFIFLYVISIQQVMGPSMNDTLKEKDIVLVNKFIYRFKDISRGDVIVFEYDGMKNFVKRVIGLPGEYVEYKDNRLYVDGVGYLEEYLSSSVTTNNFSLKDLGYDTIPDGYYLVLGDNRNNSKDSREIGLISEKDIIGKVGLRIFPFNKLGVVR